MMNHIDVVLSGADKLSQQLDEVEQLVHKLRRVLAGLEDKRLHLEMQLNPGESQEKYVPCDLEN